LRKPDSSTEQKKTEKEFWDGSWSYFQSQMRNPVTAYHYSQKFNCLAEFTNLRARSIAIYVGCGPFTIMPFMDEVFAQNPKFVGIDISLIQLKRAMRNARKHGFRNIGLVLSDVEHLPFGRRCFDLAFFIDSLHHMARPRTAISKTSEIASAVFCLEPNALNPYRRKYEKKIGDTIRETSFRLQELKDYFRQADIMPTKWGWIHFIPPLVGPRLSRTLLLFRGVERILEKSILINRLAGCVALYGLTHSSVQSKET
jgi:hypothetical protein